MNRSTQTLVLPILAALVLLAFPATPASAGAGLWTSLGPDGGQVTALAVAPSDPDVVYAGTWFSGVFRSTDGGETWAFAGRGLGNGYVFTIAVDPARPEIVYASTSNRGVSKSTDGGATWVQIWDGTLPETPGAFTVVGTLALDARRPGTVYAGTSAGVFRSTDGGVTWRHRGNLTTGVTALAVDSAGGWIFAGMAQDTGVFKSGDQGKTWVAVSQGLPSNPSVQALAIAPDQPRTLLAATLQGIFRTHDRGRTWHPVAGVPAQHASAVAFQRGGHAYAALRQSGLYRSLDGGFTWHRTLIPSSQDALFLALAAGPDTVYAGDVNDSARRGLVRSVDAGATWEPSMRGLSGLGVRPIAVDPSDSRTLYVGGVALFKSTDRGAVWTRLDLRLPPPLSAILDILIDPARPARIYATTNGTVHLVRSDDGGAAWEHLRGGSVPFLYDLAADPRAPGALWGTGTDDAGNGLFHSADAGTTWQRVEGLPVDDDFFALHIEVDPRDARVVYLGAAQNIGEFSVTEPRLFHSADGGATWERRDAGLAGGSVSDIALDPTDPSTLYALTSGVYRSTDAGLTWTLLPARGRFFTAIATAPAGPGTPSALYASRWDIVSPPAAMCSTDQGETWTALRRGLDSYTPLSLEVDPADPRRLYVGTLERGLMTYTIP